MSQTCTLNVPGENCFPCPPIALPTFESPGAPSGLNVPKMCPRVRRLTGVSPMCPFSKNVRLVHVPRAFYGKRCLRSVRSSRSPTMSNGGTRRTSESRSRARSTFPDRVGLGKVFPDRRSDRWSAGRRRSDGASLGPFEPRGLEISWFEKGHLGIHSHSFSPHKIPFKCMPPVPLPTPKRCVLEGRGGRPRVRQRTGNAISRDGLSGTYRKKVAPIGPTFEEGNAA